jgi:membrane protein implicated in regulation of membrane protease activity
MVRDLVEDFVLVLGGAALVAGAWIVYWPAGLMVAGIVMLIVVWFAHKHRARSAIKHDPAISERKKDSATFSAAAGRFPIKNSGSQP